MAEAGRTSSTKERPTRGSSNVSRSLSHRRSGAFLCADTVLGHATKGWRGRGRGRRQNEGGGRLGDVLLFRAPVKSPQNIALLLYMLSDPKPRSSYEIAKRVDDELFLTWSRLLRLWDTFLLWFWKRSSSEVWLQSIMLSKNLVTLQRKEGGSFSSSVRWRREEGNFLFSSNKKAFSARDSNEIEYWNCSIYTLTVEYLLFLKSSKCAAYFSEQKITRLLCSVTPPKRYFGKNVLWVLHRRAL